MTLHSGISQQSDTFLEFPAECRSYDGPHTRECYISLQLSIGIVTEGWLHPDNLTVVEQHHLDTLNLRYVFI